MIAPRPTLARTLLDAGWELAPSEPGALAGPAELGAAAFVPAVVPGTVGASLGAAAPADLDALDWWFRCRFEAEPAADGERLVLGLDGIATLAEVWLNGVPVAESRGMFQGLEIDVGAVLRPANELVIACRSVRAALRARPRPRWRTRVVAEQGLRSIRTSILGRAPGFAPGPAPVGPYREVRLDRQRGLAVRDCRRTVALEPDGRGRVLLAGTLEPLRPGAAPGAATVVVEGPTGRHPAAARLSPQGGCWRLEAELELTAPAPWLPHTHGTPHLYAIGVELELDDGEAVRLDDGRVGFRRLDPGVEAPGDGGLALAVNGTPVFCRGVLWTPTDPVGLAVDPVAIRRRLEVLRAAGVNMVRVAGTNVYEGDAFHDACDELGVLVWQDAMLANMDYPADDPDWLERFRAESAAQLARLGRHPSTAVVCGGSEVEQQATMLGLDRTIARGPLTRELLPALCAEHCPDAPFVPSSPCGGDLPFRTSAGVAHYFGVGAYLRPLEDARRADVRFASECLAFAHVPEADVVEAITRATPGGSSPTHPAWKRGVPRDVGAGWDFEDVRDHYLRLLYGIDPGALRSADVERYLDLSRLVTGEVIAETIGEWRRSASRCAGALILQAADLVPGAGWGLLDHAGRPKAAYWWLRRACAPVAVWTTDEGLDGVDVHVANDRPEPARGTLQVRLVRASGTTVERAERELLVAPGSVARVGVEELLGRFVDAAYAYRFGPRPHDLVAARFQPAGDAPASESIRWIGPRPVEPTPLHDSGLRGTATLTGGLVDVVLEAERPVWGARVLADGCEPDDAWFGVVPGLPRRVRLTPGSALPAAVSVVAASTDGRLVLDVRPA